jgi:hypothetical protein
MAKTRKVELQGGFQCGKIVNVKVGEVLTEFHTTKALFNNSGEEAPGKIVHRYKKHHMNLKSGLEVFRLMYSYYEAPGDKFLPPDQLPSHLKVSPPPGNPPRDPS